MTNLIGDLRSIMGTPFGGVGHAVLIFSRVTRAAFDSDSVILQLHDRIDMPESAEGKFRVDGLDPGPVRVELEGGTVHNHGWNIDLPDDGTWSLADLVDAQVDWSPAVIGRAEAAARASRDHADRAEVAADRIGTAEQVSVWAGEASGAADAAAQSESNAKQSELAASDYADSADGHASRAEAAATTAAGETSALVRSEFEGMLAASQSARDAAEGHANRAATSESNAAASEDAAKQSETNAGDFAAVATTAATEAVDAMERATDLAGGDFATREYVDGAVANALRVDTTVGTRVFFGNQRIYGNTGVRKVEDLASGMDFSGSALHTMTIRRVGDEVTLEGAGVRSVSDNWVTGTLPLGFRPKSLEYRGDRGFVRVNTTLIPIGNPSTALRISTVGTPIKVGTLVEFTAKWTTVDAWPTSLPGTPA